VCAYDVAYNLHAVVALSLSEEGLQVALFVEGQKTLDADPELRAVMRWTATWASCLEDAAIAFNLDATDRTQEFQSLQKLPCMLQGSILLMGALWALPPVRDGGYTPKQVYDFVVARLHESGVCTLQCACEVEDGERRQLLWPEKARELGGLCCGECQTEARLVWRVEEITAEDRARVVVVAQGPTAVALQAAPLRLLAAGAAAALGASKREGYTTWYNYVGRSVIGNHAYEGGHRVTETRRPGAGANDTEYVDNEQEVESQTSQEV